MSMEDINSYILNDANMMSYLKYKLENNKKEALTLKSMNKKTRENVKGDKTFYPRENDTLFWCYFLIVNGDTKYEMIHVKNSLVEKQKKIEYIDEIRTNKQILKTYKFDTLTNIENNLANDNYITIKTVMSLFAIKNVNVIFLSSKNTYYELLFNSDKPIYIIKEVDCQSKYKKIYGYEIGEQTDIDKIRQIAYKVTTLDKPIKAASSYKVQNLIDICNKLSINVNNMVTGKIKTKNELYEAIIQHF